MQRQELGRDGGQPRRQRKRRSLPDCDAYMRTGVCVLGMTCLFNHPPERQQLQLIQQKLDAVGMEENPESLIQSVIQEFLQNFTAGLEGTLTYLSGDIHSPNTGPSSSAKYFSEVDVVQRGGCSSLDSSSELEGLIKDSKVHWSELSSSNDSDGTGESNCENFDNIADGNGKSNREIFESLRQQPKYQRWLNCDVAPDDISRGSKIAEGAQAEIFEVDGVRFPGSVLKVFKKGYSLQDLKSQWPDGLLFEGQFTVLFQGGMVMEDDRFALLLLKCDMDLRKLIDVTLDKYSPLFDHSGRPRLKELRAYKSQCMRSECSTPVFSEKCAERITYRIALEMKYLHSVDILHRDFKASNILCSVLLSRCISICVADYESSIGVVGTAFWRAPEILKQLKERKPGIHFTRAADVYGFAMTCYEIWTGHIPFENYRHHDYDHVLNGARPTLPAHVPSWVKDLIQRCWHQDPSERPSFSAIVEELESRAMDEGLRLVGRFFQDVATQAVRNAVPLKRAPELVQN